ncbi:MAG: hypothetical protein BECKG1743D_GA0114223_105034 [Candidatus Kentron sp. G]|nr:MAG: hypothetical protein BECKG1743F_GA0114225_105561 [Candidatus Kentron sp. G]VFN03698.1 MAG: hypothetical protein BECKG1743D_GA0114223_105034 [Candidatus Kentron sp. G]VFN04093.1 MAG: hypothetical protein BECKG1743E_GA0114224_106921 [Candidatus Kentron sp. G]
MEIYSEAVKKSPTVARRFPGAAGKARFVGRCKVGDFFIASELLVLVWVPKAKRQGW